MAEKRKRGQNFTLEEKQKLLKFLQDFKETILNKKTDGTTNEAKNNAWINLTDLFNASGCIYRTKDSLMKLWEKMKSESKLYYTNSRRNATQTGGGPTAVKIDPILEQVCSLIGRGCTGIEDVLDSDHTVQISDSLPKVICVDNEDILNFEILSDPVINTQIVKDSQDEICTDESDTEKKCLQTPVSQTKNKMTPLWSRRRPVPGVNERSEAVSSLCTSFKDVNKKKENLEELKLELIKLEIDFKKKIYDIQLMTAEKEYEIKVEMLNQIKRGGHSSVNQDSAVQ